MTWLTNHFTQLPLQLGVRDLGDHVINTMITINPNDRHFAFERKLCCVIIVYHGAYWKETLHRGFASCGARWQSQKPKHYWLGDCPRPSQGSERGCPVELSCFVGKWRIHWYLFLHKKERSKHWRTSHIQTEFRETQHDSFGGKKEQMEEYTVKHKLRRSLPEHFFSDTHWRPAFCMFDKIQGFSWTGVVICFYTFST